MEVTAQGAPCGATVRGIDLRRPLSADTLKALRQAWLQHLVLSFPEQPLSLHEFELVALAIGPFGQDPFFITLPEHPHIAQVRREPAEKTTLFADNWHSDWSFLPQPPAATMLLGSIIPPVGGDTLFANQYEAWTTLPVALKRAVEGRSGVHSARRGYAPQGRYGRADLGRSMAIRSDESALATQLQPIARVHPETGRTALFVSPAYTIGIDGLPIDEAQSLLRELFAHQGRDDFVYRHRWQPDMLLLWDNRCLVHAATGGYEGHRRLLHRITIGERVA